MDQDLVTLTTGMWQILVASSLPLTLTSQWSFLCPKSAAEQPPPFSSYFSLPPYALHSSAFFLSITLPFCLSVAIILPSILTSPCLSLIHAHLLPDRGSSVPPSVTLLSRGERAEAGPTVQEVSEGWPLPAVCPAPVCSMTGLSI